LVPSLISVSSLTIFCSHPAPAGSQRAHRQVGEVAFPEGVCAGLQARPSEQWHSVAAAIATSSLPIGGQRSALCRAACGCSGRLCTAFPNPTANVENALNTAESGTSSGSTGGAHSQEWLRSAGAPSAAAARSRSAAIWKRRRRHQRCSSTAARRRRVCSAISAASGVCSMTAVRS